MLILLFWSMLALVFYTYVGYGAIIFFLVEIKGRKVKTHSIDPQELPTVIHLIPAYNEEKDIANKILNSLRLDYPKEKYEVWVVTDGSTDSTPDIVSQTNGVRHFHVDERKGKIHAVNRVLPTVTSQIVVFSDANTVLNNNAILHIVKHFQDPVVGVVSGEKRVIVDESDEASSAGEGIYWRYESFLKKYDYYLHSTVGAAGELFALRTELFEQVPQDTIIEDFYISLKIASSGYIIAYEPMAYAVEKSSTSVSEESKRKIRIAAGGLQAIWRLRYLANIFKYKWLSFQFLSHRVFRWTLAPLSLPFILITNLMLAFTPGGLYIWLLAMQGSFYFLALVGWIFQKLKVRMKVLFIPFYFVFMNLSVFMGFARLIKGQQSVLWQRATRKD